MKQIKRRLCVGLCIALVAIYPNLFRSENAYAGEISTTNNALHYHLDMGVYVVNMQNGKWIKGGLGETVTYPTTITFPQEIEVQQIIPLDFAIKSGLWKWGADGYTTGYNNNTKKYYDDKFEPCRTISQTNIKKIISKGKTIQFSQSVVLKGSDEQPHETYDIVGQYKKYLTNMNETKKVVVSSTNQANLKLIKQKQTDVNRLLEEISFAYLKGDNTKAVFLINELQNLRSEIEKLKTQTTKYTTVEEVVTQTKLDVDSFLKEVYKFWGGSEGLKAENVNLWQMMQNMSQLKEIPAGTEYYLVFIPTVIEYKEADHQPEQVTPPPDTNGNCTDVIKWSEIKDHSYTVGEKTYTCHHVYTYQTSLTSSATLTAAKPNGNSTTFKSGYGFKVAMNNTINTKQIGNAGACGQNKSKANDKKPVPPQSAEVKNTWSVKLKDSKVTQPQTVALVKGSATATTANFITGPNQLSPTKNALIYTDVALKGTKKVPVKHTITVYGYGGGINGVQFCKSIPLTFTINGNMYEDDWTVDGR